jgi:chromosome segregation ATPase
MKNKVNPENCVSFYKTLMPTVVFALFLICPSLIWSQASFESFSNSVEMKMQRQLDKPQPVKSQGVRQERIEPAREKRPEIRYYRIPSDQVDEEERAKNIAKKTKEILIEANRESIKKADESLRQLEDSIENINKEIRSKRSGQGKNSSENKLDKLRDELDKKKKEKKQLEQEIEMIRSETRVLKRQLDHIGKK